MRDIWRNLRAVDIPISKILRGGELGQTAAGLSRHFNEPLWASTPVLPSPHSALIEAYIEQGEALFEPERFHKTAYFAYGRKCLSHFQAFFSIYKEHEIVHIARHFAARAAGEDTNRYRLRSNFSCYSGGNSPVLVRRIRDSGHFQLADGYHRVSEAYVRGDRHVRAYVLPEAIRTPMQELLATDEHLRGAAALHQPLPLPEVDDYWPVRQPVLRVLELVREQAVATAIQRPVEVLDVGARYGWLVNALNGASDGELVARGVEVDSACVQVGHIVFGLSGEQLHREQPWRYLTRTVAADIVVCIDELPRYLLGAGPVDAQTFLRGLASKARSRLIVGFGPQFQGAPHPKLMQWKRERCVEWLEQTGLFLGVEIIPACDAQHPQASSNPLFVCVPVHANSAPVTKKENHSTAFAGNH